MKKASKTIDFSKYRVRKNPFAKRIKREGVEILHEGPSSASLREIPELGAARKTALFAKRGPKIANAVQFDEATWRKLEKRAQAANLPVEEWVRRLIEAAA